MRIERTPAGRNLPPYRVVIQDGYVYCETEQAAIREARAYCGPNDVIELPEGDLGMREDSNVSAVREKLLSRSLKGVSTYGVTTDKADLSLVDWLRHLQEELLDGVVYIEAALSKIEGSKK